MERDFLKQLDLSDETIDKIMSQYGKDIQGFKGNAEKIEELKTANATLTSQTQDYEKQLKDLKKSAGDSKELQERLDKTIADNKQATASLEAKLASQRKSFAISNALRDSGAINPKTVAPLIDMDKVSLDDKGNLVGLSDQIKPIKESNGYLFKSDTPAKPSVSFGAKGNPSHATKSIDLSKASYDEILKFKQDHPDDYKRLVQKEGE